MYQPLIVVVFFAFGLVFGSFANVVIWRLPRKESLAFPASHCTECNHQLKSYDNIPLISYLVLGGKCRYCKTPISPRYPIVELISALLFACTPFICTNLIQAVLCSAFLYFLLILSWIDFDTKTLPNKLVGLLAIIGILGVGLSYLPSFDALNFYWVQSYVAHQTLPFFGGAHGLIAQPAFAAFIGIIVTAGPAALIAWVYSLATKKQGFGMGDIKLLAVIGLYLGAFGALVLPMAAIIALIAIILISLSNQKVSLSTKIPFGPFIAIGTFVILMVGPSLWFWYIQTLM